VVISIGFYWAIKLDFYWAIKFNKKTHISLKKQWFSEFYWFLLFFIAQ